MKTSPEPKPCFRCGEPKPTNRTKYCGTVCLAAATAERTRLKDNKRLIGCLRCQGPKEPGVQGSKYCEECRRVIADSSQQAEYERGRRKSLKALQNKINSGERIPSRRIDCPAGQKWCARCQSFRPLTSFPSRKTTKSCYCIPCQKSYNQERGLLLKYNLTLDEYDEIFLAQDGRCFICKGKPRQKSLSVDHNHKTGEIRGLLCSRCNHKLLGAANDSAERLRAAADYLDNPFARSVFPAPRFVPK